MKHLGLILVFLMLAYANVSMAILDIHITEGVEDALPIAVFPLQWNGKTRLPPQHFANIIASDLRRSGQFRPLTLDQLPSLDSLDVTAVLAQDWRKIGADWVLIGSLNEIADNQYEVNYQLINVVIEPRTGEHDSSYRGRSIIINKLFKLQRKNMRYMAHRISNDVYEEIIGIRGAFTTKVAYVVINHQAPYPYQLYIADVDGFNSRLLIKQIEPLMSPAWSPNAEKIAYVTFENGRSEVVLHSVRTGEREFVSRYKGINGAPVWSPSGDKLALVLSNGSNPDIYVLDLQTKKTTQITKNRAIDTEPGWSPDGKSLIFTSDRGGKPQIYRIALGEEEGIEPRRLTFEGDYNAGASYFPDGDRLVLVHRNRGVYHIATLDLRTETLQVLTKTHLDESPSLAPNGSMILYATVSGRRQVLAAVSVDGRFSFTLPARKGEVRAPAWSPYLD